MVKNRDRDSVAMNALIGLLDSGDSLMPQICHGNFSSSIGIFALNTRFTFPIFGLQSGLPLRSVSTLQNIVRDSSYHTAFVLGAGLGTRLRPVTEHQPKPLVPVCGKALITFAFDHLLDAGFDRFIVNTHHCAHRYAEHFPEANYCGADITFRHEPQLLETGGGIRSIADLIPDGTSLLIYNGDVLTDLPLDKLMAAHQASNAEITMALRSGGGPLHIAFDPESGRVRDIRNMLQTGAAEAYLFTGIYIVEPGFIARIPPDTKISIVPILCDMLRAGEPVAGVVLDEGSWWDLGTLEQYATMQQRIQEGWRPAYTIHATGIGWPERTAPGLVRRRIVQCLRKHLHFTEANLEPLEKGGSDRKFYRLHIDGSPSRIALHYTGDSDGENERYVAVARFLAGIGVRVPEMTFCDSTQGIILMEDLGNVDLWSYRNAPPEERGKLYEKALAQIARLHVHGAQAMQTQPLPLHAPFDADLYRWEQEYFFDNCLGRHFGLSAETRDTLRSDPALQRLAATLADLPRQLVHRDFQSQNIMILEGEACLIDFQGMRFGLPTYDVASLLYDPYVELTEADREAYLCCYLELVRKEGGQIETEFLQTFQHCAMQRLMQALGAYGFLGLVKAKPRFLDFIPTAIRSLHEVSKRSGAFPALDRVLHDLITIHP